MPTSARSKSFMLTGRSRPIADRVELVQQQQARSGEPRRLEDLVEAAPALAGPLPEQLAQVDGKEPNPQLPGDRPGHEGLATAARAVLQQAATKGTLEPTARAPLRLR